MVDAFEAANQAVTVEIVSLPWGRPSRSSRPWSPAAATNWMLPT